MNPYLSQKIRVLSFVAIVLIVYLHTNLSVIADGPINSFSELMTGQVTRVAVPLFFIISGYLFFYNIPSFSLKIYLLKIKKRLKSLVIPYLFWSFVGLVMVRIVQIIIPGSFATYADITNYTVVQLLSAWLWNPIGTYQLWFVRDLFLCFLLSPLIYLVLKYLRELVLIPVLCLYFMGMQWGVSIESICFVIIGSYMAMYRKHMVMSITSRVSCCVIIGLFWIIFCAYAYFSSFYIIHCFGIIMGLFFFWIGYDCLYPKIPQNIKLDFLLKYSFFIYVAHEPLHTLVKGVFLKMGSSQLWLLCVYFVAPLLTIAICILGGTLLSRYLPRCYSFVNGGR